VSFLFTSRIIYAIRTRSGAIRRHRQGTPTAMFVRDVKRDTSDLDDPTSAHPRVPSPGSSPSSLKSMAAFMQTMPGLKTPVTRGLCRALRRLSRLWFGLAAILKGSLSDLAATLKPSRPQYPVKMGLDFNKQW
jgi:hypothetical protein